MSSEMFYEEYGYPFSGNKLLKLKKFLATEQLSYDDGIEYTINFCDSKGNIAATGSVEGNVLKCIAVSQMYQGEGLSAKVVTSLVSYAISKNHGHLFLFTKTGNKSIFRDLGFYIIAETEDVVLMENKKNGISEYVNSLKSSAGEKLVMDTGAIIVNCNPFTKGHLYLVETAAKQCDNLHIFVVSEDKSAFPSSIRYKLVKEGVKHLNNVVVHPTSDYLISSATFPTYFIKDKYKAGDINCILDLTIFCEYFAKELNISKRFVGTEPFDVVTASYNTQMKEFLRKYGIEVIEIKRYEENNHPVSASGVRKLMTEGRYEEIKKIVPKSTYEFLMSKKGMEIAERIRSGDVGNKPQRNS
ncbi:MULTISPECIES: [citrate (pro-3S)-lyase] ligase [unclassified Sedimentibacter]|uniref:[citrate (pro-3S)-lyase] ligase n=1 Tax=unclassified Sedimentibacter TaxID=2649220 RepID=UPI0027E0DF88|nr:[citrate (pro-3S)-lyase] ligase [Sedimentibacter sp. MB35-C1]WMJ77216.1 [citrate (pro-3S)-lyase] ligase [Sedimentibacter sp. MB35-C1]